MCLHTLQMVTHVLRITPEFCESGYSKLWIRSIDRRKLVRDLRRLRAKAWLHLDPHVCNSVCLTFMFVTGMGGI